MLTARHCAACVLTHSAVTLCDPVDCSPPGSSVHGIFQARVLEWVAISYSRGSSQHILYLLHLLHWQAGSLPLSHLCFTHDRVYMSVLFFSLNVCPTLSFPCCVHLFATPWTVAHQAALSMEFSRQEYWSGLPFPTPGDLPDPEIKPTSLAISSIGRQILYHWAPWEANSLKDSSTKTLLGSDKLDT